MTPEQIAAMTHAELRMEIAQRLGWNNLFFSGEHLLGGKTEMVHFSDFDAVPDWTTDISAAWKLVEEMRSNRASVSLYSQNLKEFVVTWYDFSNTHKLVMYAGSAPLAICRAWLAWREAQG